MIDKTGSIIADLECLSDKVIAIGTNFEAVGTKLSNVSTDPTSSAKALDESVLLVNTASESNKSLPTCLQTNLKEFYSDSLKSAIDSDTQYYTGFSTSLSLLSDGVKTNSLTKINQANSQISTLASQQPALFNNSDFMDLLDKKAPNAITESTKELETQTNTLNELSDKISKKYFIL